jgi:hypothetical protein
MSMEKEICAMCICGKEKKIRTIRKVKNAWPICSCKKPMTVKAIVEPPRNDLNYHDEKLIESFFYGQK